MDFQVDGSKLRRREVGRSLLSELSEVGSCGLEGELPPRRRLGTIPKLLLVLLFVYGAMVLVDPWAIHIGNQWTPLLLWTGSGKLVTANGTYPLLVTLGPSAHHSRMRLDGLLPTSGMSGWAWLCTSDHTTIVLRLYGTMYGGWGSTDGTLTEIRLNERLQNFPSIQNGGYVDLFGRWRGPKLVMDDRNEWSAPFHAGLKLKHTSVTLEAGSKSEFNTACAAMNTAAPQQ